MRIFQISWKNLGGKSQNFATNNNKKIGEKINIDTKK